MLDDEGNLKTPMLKNMGLEDIKITPHELIYIYTFVMNQQIIDIKNNFITKHEKVVNIILHHVNSHTGFWIKNELPNAGYVFIPPKIEIPKRNTSAGILLVLAAAVTTAGAGYAGYMFFKNPKDDAKPEEYHLNTKTLVLG